MNEPRLGVHPSSVVRAVPKFQSARVAALGLAPPPPKFSWLSPRNGQWNAGYNHNAGTCVLAAIAHQTQLWTSWTRPKPTIVSEAAVRDEYVKITCKEFGCYDPATGANDSGITLQDGFDFWKSEGFDGHTILKDAFISPRNFNHLKMAIWWFGGVQLVLDMPRTALPQFQTFYTTGKVPTLDVVSKTGDGAPGSWGLHMVPVFQWGGVSFVCFSWGTPVRLTNGFVNTYGHSAYVCLSKDWCTGGGHTPKGDNWSALGNIMDAVSN